ncbi:hypothetical protein WJX73_009837 [Symbiochloris irregularis]|uniref:F-box domain-containing protein n=1 Tax=Symbiochloris irregularis TaxID=706552 RepID=A0AAW1P268_9CHLO
MSALQADSVQSTGLLGLPQDIWKSQIARHLSAKDLVCLESTCLQLRRAPADSADCVGLAEACAQSQLKSLVLDEVVAQRWRGNWKRRLFIECETGCGFCEELACPAGFQFFTRQAADLPADGNTAFELGVVGRSSGIPAHTTLHKGLGSVAWGFRSTATQHSAVWQAVPLRQGYVVEVLARPGCAECIIMDPDNPSQIEHMTTALPLDADVRLAATCWGNTRLRVLHRLAHAAH